MTVSDDPEERARRAAELAASDGLTLVPPFDDARVVAGQGTVGLEIVEQVAELDGDEAPQPLTVLVPIGGGGLAAGVATAVKSLRPDARVFGVEPELAADARDSLRSGQIVRWEPRDTGRTMADGVRTSAVGRMPFGNLVRYLDGVLTVTEDEICRRRWRARPERLGWCWNRRARSRSPRCIFRADELPADGRIVAVLSGGNVDPERYRELIAESDAGGSPSD